jgi:hypothetical protein
MLSKFTNPYNGSVLLIQRPKEVADFVARQPQVLPTAPSKPATSLHYRLAIKALVVLAILLVVAVMALWFFLFGEERTERMRPELTPAQRAQAFRIPTP